MVARERMRGAAHDSKDGEVTGTEEVKSIPLIGW